MSHVLTQGALASRLRESGLRVTPQRLEVHGALIALDTHATPDDVLVEVRKRHPSISFNTVYTALETLARVGAIRRADLEAGPRRYDPNVEVHQHVVCRSCRRQQDVEYTFDIHTAASPQLERTGFAIDDAQITFYGLCPDCRTAMPAATPGA